MRGRGNKKLLGKVINEEISQKEQQPVPSYQCNNLSETLNDESSAEEQDGGTSCKIKRSPG